MPQQRFEDYGLSGGIGWEKADDLRKEKERGAQLQQQVENKNTTKQIEQEKQKPEDAKPQPEGKKTEHGKQGAGRQAD